VIFEKSFGIAWRRLERTGDLGDANETSLFMFEFIAGQMGYGERRRLMLSNTAIDAYRRPPVRLAQ
jgi:hypothetical protein